MICGFTTDRDPCIEHLPQPKLSPNSKQPIRVAHRNLLIMALRSDVEFGQRAHLPLRTGRYVDGIIFLAVGTYGLYGYAFSDFGVGHKISDTDGLRPLSGLVVGIEQGDEEGTTKILTEEKESHGLTWIMEV